MTVEASIEVALFTRAMELDVTGSPEIAWPNMPFNPTQGQTYLRVDHFPNRNTRLLVKGSAPHLRQGILQITIVTPLDKGPTPATELAGEIAAHFPADLDLFDDGVRVRIQQAPDIIPAEKMDVSWNARVDVRYEALI